MEAFGGRPQTPGRGTPLHPLLGSGGILGISGPTPPAGELRPSSSGTPSFPNRCPDPTLGRSRKRFCLVVAFLAPLDADRARCYILAGLLDCWTAGSVR